eukprot:gene27872-33656_t
MEESEQAIIDWLHTFEAGVNCTELQQLRDGVIIGEILQEIVPDFFQGDSLNRECDGNWALAAGNLRVILRSLHDYFTSVLHKKIDISSINVNEIAKSGTLEDVVELLELVVGVCVLCEDKAQFIGAIFQLNSTSQAYLKAMVEQVLSRAEDLDGAEGEQGDKGVDETSAKQVVSEEEYNRSQELIAHLTEERTRLLNEVARLESQNLGLVTQLEQQAQQGGGSEAAVAGSAALPSGISLHMYEELQEKEHKLHCEIDELKSLYEQKNHEVLQLRGEVKNVQHKCNTQQEQWLKLEMTHRGVCEELEVYKEKVGGMYLLEEKLEKCKVKLEQMGAVKQENKDLHAKIDQYLDKLSDLEASNKVLQGQSGVINSYKNKNIELEREKLELVSKCQILEEDLKSRGEETKKMGVRVKELQGEVQALRGELAKRGEAEGGAGAGWGEEESAGVGVVALKERVRELEREVNAYKQAGSTGGAEGGLNAMYTHEIEELKKIRQEREEMLLESNRRIYQLQAENAKLKEEAEEGAEGKAGWVEEAVAKELQHKLHVVSNTVTLLEEKLKDREGMINKLEGEKNKLEVYTRRSLSTFKEKFMQVLSTLKTEKQDLEEKLSVAQHKLTTLQSLYMKEERLLSSALYEIGVKIMEGGRSREEGTSAGMMTPAIEYDSDDETYEKLKKQYSVFEDLRHVLYEVRFVLPIAVGIAAFLAYQLLIAPYRVEVQRMRPESIDLAKLRPILSKEEQMKIREDIFYAETTLALPHPPYDLITLAYPTQNSRFGARALPEMFFQGIGVVLTCENSHNVEYTAQNTYTLDHLENELRTMTPKPTYILKRTTQNNHTGWHEQGLYLHYAYSHLTEQGLRMDPNVQTPFTPLLPPLLSLARRYRRVYIVVYYPHIFGDGEKSVAHSNPYPRHRAEHKYTSIIQQIVPTRTGLDSIKASSVVWLTKVNGEDAHLYDHEFMSNRVFKKEGEAMKLVSAH